MPLRSCALLIALAACGGAPAPAPVVVLDTDAAPPPTPIAAGDAGRSIPDAPSPEIRALRACATRAQNDADVHDALATTVERAKNGPIADRALVDAVWSCFARFRPSQAKSIDLVKDLRNAVLAVKDASYAPKAIEMIAAPVREPRDPHAGMDQIQFWQLTSISLLGELRHAPAARPLVAILLDAEKKDLLFPTRLALSKIPKDAEPALVAALSAQTDAEQSHVPRIADALGAIGRPTGRDAILDALPKATNDTNRAALALILTYFPNTPRARKAYLDTYAKLSPNAALPLFGGANAHATLAGAAANFFDPTLTEWLVRESASAKGDAADAMPAMALPAAIKLMTDANAKNVAAQVNKIPGQAIEKEMYRAGAAPLEACKKSVACWLKELAKPVPSAPPAARMGHVKAAWMAGMFGDASTRAALLDRLAATKDGSVRLALLEAIDHLSPTGDEEAAKKLEVLVESETAAGSRGGTDEMLRVALRLRARAM